MGLVNPHGIGIPRQLCFISNPTSFQLFEAVNCEKKKKKWCSWELLLWEGLGNDFSPATRRGGKKLET